MRKSKKKSMKFKVGDKIKAIKNDNTFNKYYSGTIINKFKRKTMPNTSLRKSGKERIFGTMTPLIVTYENYYDVRYNDDTIEKFVPESLIEYPNN